MVLNRLLLDPDPAGNAGGGVTPAPAAPAAPTTPQGNLSHSSFPSASKALGLDEPPAKTIASVYDQNRSRNIPPVAVGIDNPKPATPEPAAPAAPAPAPAAPATPPAAATPAPAPQKFKIGDKEFTQEELEKIISGQNQPAQPPVPQPAQPQQPPQPGQPTAPQPPSKEEIAQLERKWVEDRAKNFEDIDLGITKESLETVLGGGDEGVAAFVGSQKKALSTAVARAVLEARKSIYADLEQDLGRIAHMQQAVSHLLQERQQLQVYSAEQSFLHQYPEFKDYQDDVRLVTEAIFQQFPQARQMPQPELFRYVADQAGRHLLHGLKRFNPEAQFNSWKEYYDARQQKGAPAAAPAPTPTPTSAPAPAPAPALQAAAVPATPAGAPVAPTPTIRPPSANLPSAPVWNGYSQNEHKAIAATLLD